MFIDAVIFLANERLPPMKEHHKEFARAYILGAWASNMTNIGVLQISRKDWEFCRSFGMHCMKMIPAERHDIILQITESILLRFMNAAIQSEEGEN